VPCAMTGLRVRKLVVACRCESGPGNLPDALPQQSLMSRPQFALRNLQLLDGALAEAARWAGVTLTDLDTAQCRQFAPELANRRPS
jgi:hypothetical protein